MWREKTQGLIRRELERDVRLNRAPEAILEPDLPIIDPHHHLWDDRPEPVSRYLLEDVLDDMSSGHNIEASVFLQCASMYRQDGPDVLKPIGETEFVNGIAAMSDSGRYGRTRVAKGIVGYVDLAVGASVEEALHAHVRAAGERFKGIRFSTGADDDPVVGRHIRRKVPPNLLADSRLRQGFAKLAPLGLSFDTWLYFPQLQDVADLAAAFPETRIVLDHVGGLLGIGKYVDRQTVFREWSRALQAPAQHHNVFIKIGGLAMMTAGFGYGDQIEPVTSEQLAMDWSPYVKTCIDLFGPERCMFESNFPVDKVCSYATLWNAFKRVSADYSPSERQSLFSGTARSFYRL